MATGSTIYSCTFFKEIISGRSFYVPKHCQHNFIYWLLRQVFFLYLRICVLPLYRLFSTKSRYGKLMLSLFVNIFY